MISAITSYLVAEGGEAAFQSAFAELQQQVITREKGTVGFQLYCGADDARLYKVIAHFRDELAMDEHNSGLFLGAMAKRLYALCERPPEAEIMHAI